MFLFFRNLFHDNSNLDWWLIFNLTTPQALYVLFAQVLNKKNEPYTPQDLLSFHNLSI